jgi:hypothetical protein
MEQHLDGKHQQNTRSPVSDVRLAQSSLTLKPSKDTKEKDKLVQSCR